MFAFKHSKKIVNQSYYLRHPNKRIIIYDCGNQNNFFIITRINHFYIHTIPPVFPEGLGRGELWVHIGTVHPQFADMFLGPT